MPAGSVWTAPVGTKPGADGWQRIGYTSLDGGATWFDESGEWRPSDLLSLQDRVNRSLIGSDWAANGWKPAGFASETPAWLRSDLRPHLDAVDKAVADMKRASEGCSTRQRGAIATGISPQRWMDAVENYAMPSRHIVGIDEPTFNERSKPMGLTKDHNYTDSDGDTITAQTVDSDSATERGATTLLCAGGGGTYVEAAAAIPLALNVLGYDRMGKLGGFETTVGVYVSHGVLVNSQEKRDRALAIAVANLKSIDRYDQRADERRAAEEANAAALEAKEAARRRLNEAAGRISAGVVTDLNVDTLQIALADYKKAVDAVTKQYLDAF